MASGDSQQELNDHDSSSEHQQQQRPSNANAASQPPPFNPLTSASHDATSSAIGNSVVRDLMKVYESLTQSSTPQTTTATSATAKPTEGGGGSRGGEYQQQHDPAQHEYHQQHSHSPRQQQPQQHHQGYPPNQQPPPPPHQQPPGYQQQQKPHTSYPVPPPPPYHYGYPGTPVPPPSQHDSQQYGYPPPQHPPPPSSQGGEHPYYSETPYNAPPHHPPQPSPQQPPQSTAGPYMAGMHEHQQRGGYPMPESQKNQIQSSDSQQQQDGDDDENDDDDQQQAQQDQRSSGNNRSRRKRRGSGCDSSTNSSRSGGNSGSTTKSRKKSKSSTTDGRWSKRFTWPEDLHRDFVSAIFDVGLKHSSPSTILEHMPKHEQITTERIKSHLQKYRLHRAKSKKEFMTSYETSLSGFQQHGMAGVKTISGGEVAAHLTFTMKNEGTVKNSVNAASGKQKSSTASSAPTVSNVSAVASELPAAHGGGNGPDKNNPQQQSTGNQCLMLPQLTEAEKQTPIGAAMGYLMGLFFSLKQQLMVHRAQEKAAAGSSVLDSFAAGVPGHDGIVSTFDPQGHNSTNKVPSLATAAGGAPIPGPSLRNNLEESNMMKREMQNQMTFQNKMRALKQQELNKYKNVSDQQQDGATKGSSDDMKESSTIQRGTSSSGDTHIKAEDVSSGPMTATTTATTTAAPTTKGDEATASSSSTLHQGAGETAGADGGVAPYQQQQQEQTRPRGLSVGETDDFWNNDVVDEQLFEFLMNN